MDRPLPPPRVEAEQLAHELNNLLAIIGGHADALTPALPSDGADRESLDAIQRAVRAAAGLAARVRKLAPPVAPGVRGVDVAPLVAAAARGAARRFGQRLTVAAAPAPSLWSASVSATAIEHLLERLIDRVAEHMPHGAVLTVRSMNVETGPTPRQPSSRRDRWVRVEVSGVMVRPGIGASLLTPETGADDGLEELTRAGGRIQLESDGATMATWVLLLPSDGIAPLPAPTPAAERPAPVLPADLDRSRRAVAGTVLRRQDYGYAIGLESGETA